MQRFFSGSKGHIFLLIWVALALGGLIWYQDWLTAEANSIETTLGFATSSIVAQLREASSTVSVRLINRLTIADVVPHEGKFIAADLSKMEVYLYEDGANVGTYPILAKGKEGTHWETPSGMYDVRSKNKDAFSILSKVYMPYSMQFYGNYFIHGWPYYPDGTPVATAFSGGCIRLATADAAKVYAFAPVGTALFVYDGTTTEVLPAIPLASIPLPTVSAQSYLVADIDTGDVYAEKGAGDQVPIASITKLMTALVANETISFERDLRVPRGILAHPQVPTDTNTKLFRVADLLYPLLMESNNAIANNLADFHGSKDFIAWMNRTALALDMRSTHFADASGASPENTSTPEDLYRLAVYLVEKKSFIWTITRTPSKTITAADGTAFAFTNYNEFSGDKTFFGGKVGHTGEAHDTMLSVFSVPLETGTRHIVVVVLGSRDYTADTRGLEEWFASAASQGSAVACVGCAAPHYRQIQL